MPLHLLVAVVSTLDLVQQLQAAAGAAGLSAESDLDAAVAFAGAAFRVGELNVAANEPYLEEDEVAVGTQRLKELRGRFDSLVGVDKK